MMNSCLNVLLTALVTLAVSVGASAKDKNKNRIPGPSQSDACHWLQNDRGVQAPDEDLCLMKNKSEYRKFKKGYAQCGAFIVTAYCHPEQAAKGAYECLYKDDEGDTKDCYERSLAPFADRMQKLSRGAVVKYPTCVWATDSFLPANNIDAYCDGEPATYRRASCQIEGQQYNPMLLCRVADASDTAASCLKDEGSPKIKACRWQNEAVLEQTRQQLNKSSGTVR